MKIDPFSSFAVSASSWNPTEHHQTCTVAGSTFPFMHKTNPSWNDRFPDEPIPIPLKICTGPGKWGTDNRIEGLPIETINDFPWTGKPYQTWMDAVPTTRWAQYLPPRAPAETTLDAVSSSKTTPVGSMPTLTLSSRATSRPIVKAAPSYETLGMDRFASYPTGSKTTHGIPSQPSPNFHRMRPTAGTASGMRRIALGCAALVFVAAIAMNL